MLCRPSFQQLVAILTEIEVEFRRECHRQRPAMAVGAAPTSPTPAGGRRKGSVGPGGIPHAHGVHKPPSRFGSVIDANTMLYAGATAQFDVSARANVGQSRLST